MIPRMMATRSRSTRVSTKASVVDHQSPTVVVAGAGIVGSSTAYFLAAEQSLRPVLLDASYPAASASGKAGGFLAETWSDGSPTQELARRGFALHKEWSETEFTNVDYRFGIDAVSGTLGSSDEFYRYIGCERRACGQVHPKKLTNSLAERVVALGGEVRSGTTLLEVLLESDVVKGVKVRNAEAKEEVVKTGTVVLALGAWTSVTLKTACAPAHTSVRPEIAGHKVHSIVVRDSRQGDKRVSTSVFLQDEETGADPEAYPRPDGTLYVCGNQGGRSYDSHPPQLASEVGVEKDGSVSYLESVSAVLLGTDCQDVETLERQACYLPTSSTGRPVISQVPGISGLYVNAGHSCWGILQGGISGKALAELIGSGESRSVDLRPFAL